MTDIFLSVVIPAYNEEERLGSTLEQIVDYLLSRHFSFELVVVDDGSQDRTAAIVLELSRRNMPQLRLFQNRCNRGKGYSVRLGMLQSSGQYALLTDADLSTPIQELCKLEQALANGPCDIVFGSRDLESSEIQVRQPWLREGGGKLFNRLVRLLTHLPYRDTQCGFKLFKMPRCRDIFRKQVIENFSFDVEVLYIARKWGFRLEEVPVIWRHNTGSRVKLVSDGLTMMFGLFTILRRDFRGDYSLEDNCSID